jgi:hypothetical protein
MLFYLVALTSRSSGRLASGAGAPSARRRLAWFVRPMLRRAAPLALLTGLTYLCAFGQSTQPNPLVGKWRYVDENGCTDTYEFQTDGTFSSNSGSESLEGTYTVEAPTNASRGAYLVTRNILKGNGRLDCVGHVTSRRGKRGIGYTFFNGELNDLFVCQSPSSRECFGPVRRIAR